MPTIDASIYNALLQPRKSAMDYADEYAAADDRQMARQFNALKMQEAQQGLQDQAGYRRALGAATGTDEERINALLRSGNPLAIKLGLEMQKALLDAQKVQTDIGKTKAETGKFQGEAVDAALKRYRGALDFIDTPQGAQRWLQAQYSDPATAAYMQQLGPFEQAVTRIPTDPQGFQNWRGQAAMGMEKHMQQLRADAVQAETVRHNKESERLTVRGQDKVAETARLGREQADRHFNTTQANAGTNATEDERKAYGWLSQAENAWNNMQAVAFGEPGKDGKRPIKAAATPGLLEQSMWFSDTAKNVARSSERQQFVQASSSLSEALLRAATGAGVNKDEAAQKIAELTPQWGDSEAVIRQKFDAVPMYLQSLKSRAGRAIPKDKRGGGSVNFEDLK